MNKNEFTLKALEYEKVNEEIKKLTKTKTAINAVIKEEIKNFGEVTPTGSIIFETVYADKAVKVSSICKTSATLVSDAQELLTKNKKTEFLEEITIVRVDRLQEAIERGDLKQTLVDDLYETTESFALSISVKPA